MILPVTVAASSGILFFFIIREMMPRVAISVKFPACKQKIAKNKLTENKISELKYLYEEQWLPRHYPFHTEKSHIL